jgi:hypothetical protein
MYFSALKVGAAKGPSEETKRAAREISIPIRRSQVSTSWKETAFSSSSPPPSMPIVPNIATLLPTPSASGIVQKFDSDERVVPQSRRPDGTQVSHELN